MQLSPALLIALLRNRGIRVEVEELLRLHEALQAGADWTPQRLENVVVGILATCPEDPARIREAIRELRHALEPTLAEGTTGPADPTPGISRRLALTLGLGGVATAAAVALLRPGCEDELGPTSTTGVTDAADDDVRTPDNDDVRPPDNNDVHPVDNNDVRPVNNNHAGAADSDGSAVDTPDAPAPAPPVPPPASPPAWTTKEHEDQARYRAAQKTRRADESAARLRAIAEIDRARTSRRVAVPRLVPKPASWARLIGAGLLGPAAVAGSIAWLAHRSWRRRLRETRRIGDPVLEVAPGPSLFWLAARDRRWLPLLGAEAREALVWGVDQAASEEPTHVLDEDATIAATIEHGGLPELRFRGRRSLRRVWLWHDRSAAGAMGAQLCAEVQQTLHRYGLAVEVGHYWGLPDRLEREDGRLLSLDALEEEREVSTVVVLTDGDDLLRQWDRKDPQGRSRQPHIRMLLGRLAGWANLTIVHTGSRERQRALRALLDPLGIPCIPLEALPLAVRERDHLAQTLGTVAPTENVWIWAALCALYPLPVPESLALALLRHLGLPISPLSLNQLLDQSVTTAGIQFKPAARARLIERLRRTLDDGSGALPPAMRQALAFWRAHTIVDDPKWASDTTGRGLHRRLVVALLDVWTDPERAALELSTLSNSPHIPAIREELGRMRPTGNDAGAPEPGTFHVPIDLARLSSTTRVRLAAAGMQGLPAPDPGKSSPDRWPLPLRGLIACAILLFVAGVALLAIDALRPRTLDVDELSRWALAIRTDTTAGDRLQAHVAGEWYEVGDWPIALDVALEIEAVEVRCPAADGALRRCPGEDTSRADPPRRIAILDAPPDSDDAVRFADSLLDNNRIDAAWIGTWPPWLVDRSVHAIEGRHGLEVWVFTNDPEFVQTGAGVAKVTPYPPILADATGRVLASGFCPGIVGAVCAVTTTGNVGRFLRGTLAGTETTELRGHEGPLTAAALSPDGRRIVTSSDDRTARVWSTDGSGEPVVLRGHEGSIRSVAWSPDSTHIVTASADTTARIWTTDGTQAGSLAGHKGEALSAAWSPDGARIVTTYADRTAQIWRADGSGAPVKLTGHTGPVTFARWSPDGRHIVTTSADKTALVWNVDNPGDPVVLAGHDGAVTTTTWYPDGQRIITGSADDTARMWNPATGAVLAILRYGDGSGLSDIAASDAGYVLTASESGTVRVWKDGRPVSGRADISALSLGPLRAWDDDPSSLTLTHRSTDWPHLLDLFSAYNPGESTIRDRHEVDLAGVFLENPRALLVAGVPAPVTAATDTGDGSVHLGTWDGDIYRWSAASGVVKAGSGTSPITLLESTPGATLSVDDMARGELWISGEHDPRYLEIDPIKLAVVSLDRTGIAVATTTGDVLMIDPEHTNRSVKIYDGANFKGREVTLKVGKYDSVGAASASLSSLRLSPGLEAVLYDAANFKGEARAYSADVATVGDFDDRTRSIEIRSVDDVAPQAPEHIPQYGSVDAMASRSSDHVALISGGALHVCEKAPAWACRKLEPGLAPQLVAASPNDVVLAVASKDRVPTIGVLPEIGEAATDNGKKTLQTRFKGPIGWPVALRYGPDGAHLAVASLDGTVRLVKVTDKKEDTDPQTNAGGEECPRILRHETPLRDIAFSPDSTLLATASFDGDVRVFRAEDGAGPVRLTGHRGPVRSVSFLASGTEPRLVSVSDDGTARLWAVPTAAAFAGATAAETLCDPEPDCPDGQVREGDRCVSACPEGQLYRGGACVLLVCPRGMTFVEGTQGHEFKRAGRQRDIDDFCMDTTEVTVGAYRKCVNGGTCAEPFSGKPCNWGIEGREAHPMNCMNWHVAKTYCASLGKRLPDEWEWEWAARGRDEGRKYPWGSAAPNCSRAIFSPGAVDGCGQDRTWPVGSKSPSGDSRDGIKDLSGNVWEWMNGNYDNANMRTLRGGGWNEIDASTLRATNRDGSSPTNGTADTGFRCAKTVAASRPPGTH